MKGFEVEYFSDIGTGPRYRVDAETGEIAKDDLFMHGEGPLAGSDDAYPGDPDIVTDAEVTDQAYEKILEAGLEPGESYEERPLEGQSFRVEVYDGTQAEPEEVEEVNAGLIRQATEGLEELF